MVPITNKRAIQGFESAFAFVVCDVMCVLEASQLLLLAGTKTTTRTSKENPFWLGNLYSMIVE